MIVEVTSPGTTRIDHHEKMLAYRQIDSLREYLLVAQDQMQVEVFARDGEEWKPQVLRRPDENVRLESVALSISLADIYRNVDLSIAPD